MNLVKDDVNGILKISGRLEIDRAGSLRESLLDCFARRIDLEADLSGVDSCDTAALQVLLAGRKDFETAALSFRFSAVSEAVTETAAALGLSHAI